MADLEKLSQNYDEANDKVHEDPSDENIAARKKAADKLAAARSEERTQREADAASLNDGQARPGSVAGSTEVS